MLTGKLEGLSTGGTTDWESTTEPSFGAAHDDGGCGLDEKPPNIGHGPRSSGSGGGGVGGGSANTSTTGTGGGDGDASVGTADEVRYFSLVYGDKQNRTMVSEVLFRAYSEVSRSGGYSPVSL